MSESPKYYHRLNKPVDGEFKPVYGDGKTYTRFSNLSVDDILSIIN